MINIQKRLTKRKEWCINIYRKSEIKGWKSQASLAFKTGPKELLDRSLLLENVKPQFKWQKVRLHIRKEQKHKKERNENIKRKAYAALS